MKTRIKLTKSQWERTSEILGGLGIVSLVGFVIPYFSGQTDIIRVLMGLVMSVGMWYISIVLARKY